MCIAGAEPKTRTRLHKNPRHTRTPRRGWRRDTAFFEPVEKKGTILNWKRDFHGRGKREQGQNLDELKKRDLGVQSREARSYHFVASDFQPVAMNSTSGHNLR
jgi:hypothetical protein